jgi:hypothetical protein
MVCSLILTGFGSLAFAAVTRYVDGAVFDRAGSTMLVGSLGLALGTIRHLAVSLGQTKRAAALRSKPETQRPECR